MAPDCGLLSSWSCCALIGWTIVMFFPIMLILNPAFFDLINHCWQCNFRQVVLMLQCQILVKLLHLVSWGMVNNSYQKYLILRWRTRRSQDWTKISHNMVKQAQVLWTEPLVSFVRSFSIATHSEDPMRKPCTKMRESIVQTVQNHIQTKLLSSTTCWWNMVNHWAAKNIGVPMRPIIGRLTWSTGEVTTTTSTRVTMRREGLLGLGIGSWKRDKRRLFVNSATLRWQPNICLDTCVNSTTRQAREGERKQIQLNAQAVKRCWAAPGQWKGTSRTFMMIRSAELLCAVSNKD